MAKYIVLAINGPTSEDADGEYNQWYNNNHAPELVAVPGIKSCRRFKIVQQNLRSEAQNPYLALYEVETDDLSEVFKGMGSVPTDFPAVFDKSKSQSLVAVQIGEFEE